MATTGSQVASMVGSVDEVGVEAASPARKPDPPTGTPRQLGSEAATGHVPVAAVSLAPWGDGSQPPPPSVDGISQVMPAVSLPARRAP